MPETLRQQIEAIHASPTKMVVATTGGGATAIGELQRVPGASNTLLEAIVPYCEASLDAWLAGAPEQSCSERTARAMAMAAYLCAREFQKASGRRKPAGLSGETLVAGVAATAALATSREKRSAHRVHVAWQTASATATLSLELEKGARDREGEETVACKLILLAAAEACGLEPFVVPTLRADEQIVRRRVDALAEWQDLLAGNAVSVALDGALIGDQPVLFPGAFNPLHRGHLTMAQVAGQLFGKPVTFELSIANVDKPPLDFLEMKARTQQFTDHPLMLTCAATFVEKAQLYPGATFVVGADTITRIGEVKYYGDDVTSRDEALAELSRLRCRFIVFGRESEGQFLTLSDLNLPGPLLALCSEVPASKFRDDISSTELRS